MLIILFDINYNYIYILNVYYNYIHLELMPDKYRNRSGVVELVGREPLIIARVENGVTKFSPQRQKTPKFSRKKFGSGKQFSVGILAAGKLTFGGGV